LPFCEKCRKEYDNGAAYCSHCGAPSSKGRYIDLATWGQRLIALIIDSIILGIILGLVRLPGYYIHPSIPVSLGANNVLEFLYFMFLDYYWGQSLGKKALGLRVTKVGGGSLTLIDAAIEAFGKAFLLPIDFIIGIILYKDRTQRLFNYLSDTVVIQNQKY
jgi:uncharacterized RDD family membrane protein YckC